MESRLRVIFGMLLLILGSCSEDENPTIGFTTTSGSGTEGDGTQNLIITFGKKLASSTTVTLKTYGTAALDGDYSFTSSSPGSISNLPPEDNSSLTFTAQAGTTSLTIPFKIIDDKLVEPRRDVVQFQIASISNSDISKNLTQDVYTFEIIDNDTPPTQGLQVDLSWDLGDGVSINDANFDIYLANNVTFDSQGLVSSAQAVSDVSSSNTTGFESYIIPSTLADGIYYVIIKYAAGSNDAGLELILSRNQSYSRATGYVTASYTGKQIAYGPIRKTGDSYTGGD
jgi:hypothetical protein